MNNNQFLSKAQEIFHQMREIRRDLHRHPELGLQEKRTSGIVADYLERLGLDVEREIGGTGGSLAIRDRRSGKWRQPPTPQPVL